MDEVICNITWTRQDFYDAFIERHHRIPSDQELTKCIDNFCPTKLQDRSIEYGWNFVYEAVEKL